MRKLSFKKRMLCVLVALMLVAGMIPSLANAAETTAANSKANVLVEQGKKSGEAVPDNSEDKQDTNETAQKENAKTSSKESSGAKVDDNQANQAGVSTPVNSGVAKIGTKEYTTLNAALADVNNQSGSSVELTILSNIEEELTASYKFAKNLTITSASPLTVNVKNSNNGYLIPDNGTTLKIDKNITLDNVFSIGADETSGTLVVDGNVSAQYVRAYGPKNSSAKANLVINGKVKAANGEGAIRVSQNSTVTINGNIPQEKDVTTGELQVEGMFIAHTNSLTCNFTLNNAAIQLSAFFDVNNANIDFTLNHSYINVLGADYPKLYLTDSSTMTLKSASVINVDDAIIIDESANLSIAEKSRVAANKIDNKGTITVDMTGFSASVVKLIDSKIPGSNYGNYKFAEGKAGNYTLQVIDGDLYAVSGSTVDKIAINSAWKDKKYGDEVDTGFYYGINAYSSADEASTAITSDTSEIVAYGGNNTLGILTVQQDIKVVTKNTDSQDAKFDKIVVETDKTLNIADGSKINSAVVDNKGNVKVEGTIKLSSADWNGNFDVKDATLTTDGFTQKSGKVQAFGASKMTNFNLQNLYVGFKNGSTTSDVLTLAGESKTAKVYLGQDDVATPERTYQLNIEGTANLDGQIAIRQNGQLNLNNAKVTTGYNIVYGQINIKNNSEYIVNGSNFYLDGREDKNAKDKAIITVDNSKLNFSKAFALEIGGGSIYPVDPRGSGQLILNKATVTGSAISLDDNADGSLGTIGVNATDSTINLTGAFTNGKGDDITLKNSKITSKTFTNNGEVIVDMTGATDPTVKLIEAEEDSSFGVYKFAEGKGGDYALSVENNCLVAKITDCAENVSTGTKYNDLHQAFSECTKGQTIKLLRDVSLSGEWAPISNFEGNFDGNNKTISNLNISGSGNLGIFTNINGGYVKDFTLSNAQINGTEDEQLIGFITGHGYGEKIDNITIKDSKITSSGKYVGGIVGKSDIDVTNCKLENVQITGKEQVGGLVGYLECGYVNNNTLTGITVKATSNRAGGLIGKLQCDKENIPSTGNYQVNSNKIVNSTTNGENSVEALDMVGGIAGQLMGTTDRYQINNNEIDIKLNAPKTSPIGILRNFNDGGIDTTFTSKLSTNIIGNSWTKATYPKRPYIYSNSETQSGEQIINNNAEKIQLTVEGTTVSDKSYDGTTAANVTLGDVSGILEGDDVTVKATGEFDQADAGSSISVPVTYTLEGKDAGWYAAPDSDTLSANINKRAVTLTSESAKKVYDGTPLTAKGVTEGEEGFVAGEGATYDVTGTQTEVGKSENTFTYKLKSGTNKNNYEIQTVYGTLEVVAATPDPGPDNPGQNTGNGNSNQSSGSSSTTQSGDDMMLLAGIALAVLAAATSIYIIRRRKNPPVKGKHAL